MIFNYHYYLIYGIIPVKPLRVLHSLQYMYIHTFHVHARYLGKAAIDMLSQYFWRFLRRSPKWKWMKKRSKRSTIRPVLIYSPAKIKLVTKVCRLKNIRFISGTREPHPLRSKQHQHRASDLGIRGLENEKWNVTIPHDNNNHSLVNPVHALASTVQ